MSQTPTTLLDLVEEGFSRNTTGMVAATKRDGRWIETPLADFRRQVEEIALGLYALGVRPGDRVAIHSENSTEWLIADQATLSIGAVTVPIYSTQPGDQVEYILRDAEATAYIVSTAELYSAVADHLDTVPSLKATIGIRGAHVSSMLPWEEVLVRGRRQRDETPSLLASLRAPVRPEDLATLIYTSGTTGMPKGVMLTHANLTSNVLSVLERIPFDLEGGRGGRMLSYLPLSHVLERMLSYLYLHIGYPIWFVEGIEQILEDMQTVRPVHFSSVPRLLEKVVAGIHAKASQLSGAQRAIFTWGIDLADRYDVERPLSVAERVQYALADALVYGKIRSLFGGNLVAITSGGAALSGEVMNFMNAIGIFCGQGYGLSETSPVLTVYEKGKLRAGSVGTPIPGVEIRIAEDGEILARGPNVMKGYFRMPEATAEVLTADGWLRTGDVGYMDESGNLFITDRKKELLKLSTGKYIAPAPIETRLAGSRFVEQAVVIGNARQFCSALVVLDAQAVRLHLEAEGRSVPDEMLDEDPRVLALIRAEVDRVNEELPPWEQVKRFTLLRRPWSVEGGELTPTLKIKRRVIHEKHAREIQSMYQ